MSTSSSPSRFPPQLQSEPSAAAPSQRTSRPLMVLVVAGLLALTLPHIPILSLLAWPLTLLHTVVHELGHGLAALMVGGRFTSFEVFADASGVAHCAPPNGDGWRRAMISAGGLVGPAVAALFFFGAGVAPRLAQLGLVVLGGAFALAAVAVSSSLLTTLLLLGLGGALAVGALAAGRRAHFLAQFLAVQLALSVFSRGGYLFVDVANLPSGPMPSDVANMATAMGGHYLVWGAVVGGFSVLVLVAGLAFVVGVDRLTHRGRR